MEFIISLLSTPAVLLGVVACIGLILQKKSAVEVFTGASKTLIGFFDCWYWCFCNDWSTTEFQ